MNYCTNCGAKVSPNSSFCTSCGSPINGAPYAGTYQNQAVQSNKTNVFAIVGFVCSLVVGSITGIIFSCIGLSEAKKTNNGKGLAIAGLIISIVRIVLVILYLIFVFAVAANYTYYY